MPAGLLARRLHSQRLAGEAFATPVEAVRWLGAVQAQDYAAAKWALGLRSAATDAELDGDFDAGRILRTHVLRPTWHFVLPEDARWLVKLTGPRIRRSVAGQLRRLEIDEEVVGRSQTAFAEVLAGGRHLTRGELGQALEERGLGGVGLRLGYLVMVAELDGLLISGPRRGRAFTYALLDERVPAGRELEGGDALAELARRYFRSHGPAQTADFAWWSGLTVGQARRAVAAAGGALEREVAGGEEYWFDPSSAEAPAAPPTAHLLPNFDEYTVGYRDRSALLGGRRFDPSIFAFGSVLANVVTVAGEVRGAWRRTLQGRAVRIEVRLLERLSAAERRAVEESAERLARFLGRPVALEWR